MLTFTGQFTYMWILPTPPPNLKTTTTQNQQQTKIFFIMRQFSLVLIKSAFG